MELIDKQELSKYNRKYQSKSRIDKPEDKEIYIHAEKIKEKLHSISLSGQNSIWIYNTKYGIFVPQGEELIQDLCYKTPGWNHNDIAKRLITTVGAISRIEIEEFDSDPLYINFINGVLPILEFDDDSDENLIPHSSEYKFKYCLPFYYDAKADCPNFKQLLNNMFEEKDIILILRWMSYHFYRGDHESKSLFIVGPPQTGKGLVCDTIKNINGHQNCNYASFRDLSEDRHYSVANLFGKIANIDFDLSYKAIKDTGMFKKLTSGESVTVRMIRNKPFSFNPDVRFTFACNKLPYLSPDILYDDAFWRRVIILQTEKRYTEKDKHLYTNIFNERAGIFNLIFKELREMIQNPGFIFEDIDYRKIWTYSMMKWKYNNEQEISIAGDQYDTMMENVETDMTLEEILKTKQLSGEEIKRRALQNRINADIKKMSMKQFQ